MGHYFHGHTVHKMGHYFLDTQYVKNKWRIVIVTGSYSAWSGSWGSDLYLVYSREPFPDSENYLPTLLKYVDVIRMRGIFLVICTVLWACSIILGIPDTLRSRRGYNVQSVQIINNLVNDFILHSFCNPSEGQRNLNVPWWRQI